ncbi:hypothetical protein [Pedobacter helvus]|uniref:Uncharacterized protein n=1 Tax=Pedobacter helvus TaxID=2563444 RepID=A0ABW9JGV1_9SPHI|nr:hypothetical protein [Pedobacter ureilyticus]
MKIKNIDGLSVSEIRAIIADGGRFVYFPYTVSVVLATFKRASSIYLIRPYEKSIKYSYRHVLTNAVAGWWGIPWGPVYTIGSIYAQMQGGKDVTDAVMSELMQHDPEANTSTYNIGGVVSSNQAQSDVSTPTYNIPK